ncbi:MAG: CRTAC1 family protein [Isosphaeraceae bacterium]|nr:CRTAC1 family protein [Isosphaeraceae bacterium]
MRSRSHFTPAQAACGVGVCLLLTMSGCGPSNVTEDRGKTATVVPAPVDQHTTSSVPAANAAVTGDRMANVAPEPVTLSKQATTSPFRFAEISKEAGVDFVHFSGMTDKKEFPTANGSGVAVFDYDNDGLLDIYFATATLFPVGSVQKGPNRLFKNLGGNKFRDVTDASGLEFRGFCHGIVVGDVDNDGDQDVFLCNYGPNVFYLNNGNGTFTDVSKTAGIDRAGWSSGGAFLDYDNDGDLDLYVANYGVWKYPDDNIFCGDAERHVRLYCSPRSVKTTKHFFYRNNGDGTFTDVYDSVITTLDPETKKRKPNPRDDGHGFAAVTADLNGDGLIDIYVANDMNPNFLFINLGDGTFDDATESSGAAYDEKGQAQSGMGVDAEDVNGDGLPDLFVTNFANEYNTLYINNRGGYFMDSTPYYGLAADTMPWVGWGTAIVDLDNDGWPDNFVANGHVDDNRRLLNQPVDYEEFPLLFVNLKGKRFRLATRDAGEYFDTKHVGRGAAFGDLDNDGDVDIVVNHKDRPCAVLRNDTKNDNRWIRLDLQGTKSNRDAIGARVEVVAGDRTIYRQRKGNYSMLSANDPRLLIGVGAVAEVEKVTVHWPSGRTSVLEHLKTNQAQKVVEPSDDAAKR